MEDKTKHKEKHNDRSLPVDDEIKLEPSVVVGNEKDAEDRPHKDSVPGMGGPRGATGVGLNCTNKHIAGRVIPGSVVHTKNKPEVDRLAVAVHDICNNLLVPVDIAVKASVVKGTKAHKHLHRAFAFASLPIIRPSGRLVGATTIVLYNFKEHNGHKVPDEIGR